jgi:hypothetical protein
MSIYYLTPDCLDICFNKGPAVQNLFPSRFTVLFEGTESPRNCLLDLQYADPEVISSGMVHESGLVEGYTMLHSTVHMTGSGFATFYEKELSASE